MLIKGQQRCPARSLERGLSHSGCYGSSGDQQSEEGSGCDSGSVYQGRKNEDDGTVEHDKRQRHHRNLPQDIKCFPHIWEESLTGDESEADVEYYLRDYVDCRDHRHKCPHLGDEVSVNREGSGEIDRQNAPAAVGYEQKWARQGHEQQGYGRVEIEQAAVGRNTLPKTLLDVPDGPMDAYENGGSDKGDGKQTPRDDLEHCLAAQAEYPPDPVLVDSRFCSPPTGAGPVVGAVSTIEDDLVCHASSP